MDIAEHLALHDRAIRAWVYKNIIGNRDLADDAYQNIVHAMIEFHAGGYDHNAGELLTVLWPYLRGIAFRGYKAEYLYGVKHDLDQLQEMAENVYATREDKIHLDPLYESPIDGLKTALESGLSEDDEKLVQVLKGGLTEDELAILIASYGMSERDAAASLGMAKTTYRERLARGRERAKAILDVA